MNLSNYFFYLLNINKNILLSLYFVNINYDKMTIDFPYFLYLLNINDALLFN